MAAPRLACLSPHLWPGLVPTVSGFDGAGLELPCHAPQPFAAPSARQPHALRLGGAQHQITGSGRYAASLLRTGAAPVQAEVTIWILADGRFVIEPLNTPPHLTTAQAVQLKAHLGADARGIRAQMAGLHLLRIGANDLIDTVDGPRPARSLAPGQRVGTFRAGPQPLRAVLACRGSGRGGARVWQIAAETFGNAAPLTLPPKAHILTLAAMAPRGLSLSALAPHPGLTRASAGAVDWVVLGFGTPQMVAAQGLFLPTSPPA